MSALEFQTGDKKLMKNQINVHKCLRKYTKKRSRFIELLHCGQSTLSPSLQCVAVAIAWQVQREGSIWLSGLYSCSCWTIHTPIVLLWCIVFWSSISESIILPPAPRRGRNQSAFTLLTHDQCCAACKDSCVWHWFARAHDLVARLGMLKWSK